jgi:hemoglobin/transferrin/lactoferrin receptor protein
MPGSAIHPKANGSKQTVEGRSSLKNGSNNLLKERDKINTIGITADISSVFTNAWTANSGIEVYLDKVNSTKQNINMQNQASTWSRGLYPDDARYGNYSVYSLHHISFHKWLLEAGLRYNSFAINIADTSLGKVKITPSSFVYNAALMYNLSQAQHFYITFNTGYRAPNIDDMGTLGIVDFRYEVPAFNLEPERSRNIELGYKMQAGKWSGTLSAYYMHVNNLITRVKTEGQVINGYPVYQKENVEEAYLKGFEAELGYIPFTGWQFKANIASTYGQNLTKKEPLRRIPPVNGKLMARYNKSRWFAAAEWLYAARQDRLAQGDKEDNRIPKGGTPGWNFLNLYAGYQLAHVKFNIGLQNLFNEDYRTHGSGINGVGRSAWLSVALNL